MTDQSAKAAAEALKSSNAQARRVMNEMTDIIARVIADRFTPPVEGSDELILIADDRDEDGAKVGFQMSVGGHLGSARIPMLHGHNMWAVVSVSEANAIFRAALGMPAPIGLAMPGAKPHAKGTRVLMVTGGGFFPVTLPPLLSPGGTS